jgi:hypothetical protein
LDRLICLFVVPLFLVPSSESNSELRMQHKSRELPIPGLSFVTGHGFRLFATSHGSQIIPDQLGIYIYMHRDLIDRLAI